MKNNLYFKICLIHLIVYYIVLGVIFESLSYWYSEWNILKWDFLGKIVMTPFITLLGVFDGFLVYFFFIVFFIVFKYLNIKTLKSYALSAIVVYVIGLYLCTCFTGEDFQTNIMANSKEKTLQINMLYLILPSLLISSLTIWKFLKHKEA